MFRADSALFLMQSFNDINDLLISWVSLMRAVSWNWNNVRQNLLLGPAWLVLRPNNWLKWWVWMRLIVMIMKFLSRISVAIEHTICKSDEKECSIFFIFRRITVLEPRPKKKVHCRMLYHFGPRHSKRPILLNHEIKIPYLRSSVVELLQQRLADEGYDRTDD